MKKLTILLGLLFVLAACRREEQPVASSDGNRGAARGAKPAATATGTEVGSVMPEYSAMWLDGSKFDLETRREKVVLLNVWATWCGPCVAELPELLTMNRMYRGRKFRLVTISLDDPEQKADAHKALKELQMSTTNYLSSIEKRDRFADLLDKDWKGPLPHTVVFAPGGKVVYRKNGPLDPLELKRAIADQLGRTYANKK